MKKPNILDFKKEAEKMRIPLDKAIRDILAEDPTLASELIIPVLLELEEVKGFLIFVRNQAPKAAGDMVEKMMRDNMAKQFEVIINKVRADSF